VAEFRVGDRVQIGKLSGRPYGDSQDGKFGVVEMIGWGGDKKPNSLADKLRIALDDDGIIWVGPDDLLTYSRGLRDVVLPLENEPGVPFKLGPTPYSEKGA